MKKCIIYAAYTALGILGIILLCVMVECAKIMTDKGQAELRAKQERLNKEIQEGLKHLIDDRKEELEANVTDEKYAAEVVNNLLATEQSQSCEYFLEMLQDESDEYNKDSPILYSSDYQYTAQIVTVVHPYTKRLIEENKLKSLEFESHLKYGIRLHDLQSGTVKDLYDEIYRNGDDICRIAWSAEGSILYFNNGGDTIPSFGVYAYDPANGEVKNISGGYLSRVITGGEYAGYIEVVKSYIAKGGGRYWYKAIISPENKEEIRLTEPSMAEIPEF